MFALSGIIVLVITLAFWLLVQQRHTIKPVSYTHLDVYKRQRYACAKLGISSEKPMRYEMGMVGNENLDEELEDDEYFGVCVDAGMACICLLYTSRCV